MDVSRGDRLVWEACYNARDLGGYGTTDGGRTAHRRFFRADNLCRLTASGCEAVVRDGVRTVIDLRSRFELELDPCPFTGPRRSRAGQEDPAYVHVPLLNERDGVLREALDLAPTVAGMYALILERCAAGVGAVFAAMAAAPVGGVLVYCHAGKDRTGIVAALALDVAGVPAETIAADYALSDRFLQPLYDAQLGAESDRAKRERLEARLRSPSNAADPATMLATLAQVEQRYGGVASYLRRAGVTPGELDSLRGRLRA